MSEGFNTPLDDITDDVGALRVRSTSMIVSDTETQNEESDNIEKTNSSH